VSRIRVRAPATTANVGPGFDCAAIALDFWNELEVEEDDDAPEPDHGHVGIKAFGRLAPPTGRRFAFTTPIPRERGLGSSASVIALGLVGGALAAGLEPEAEALLAEGLPLEGHPDNLAAALAGGVCLTWEGRIRRITDDVPAVPIALIPSERVNTLESRHALPKTVPHKDAAFTAARAALLGASLAACSEELFAAALDDRLHEPYRSPFLAEVRASLPTGALGATLSGSGPTVIVWARKGQAEACEQDLRSRFPEHGVLQLAIAAAGAGPIEP
jgi:homoserine kinase